MTVESNYVIATATLSDCLKRGKGKGKVTLFNVGSPFS